MDNQNNINHCTLSFTHYKLCDHAEREGERAIPNMDNGLLSFGFPPPPPPPPPSFKSSSARAAPNRRCEEADNISAAASSTCNVWASKPAAGGLRRPRRPRRGLRFPKWRRLVKKTSAKSTAIARNEPLIAPTAADRLIGAAASHAAAKAA